MDFGQWLVVTPSCDVFKLNKMQVQISKCSNLPAIQPWNVLCTGEYLQPCLNDFGHNPSCISTKMTGSPTLLLVLLKLICYGRDISLVQNKLCSCKFCMGSEELHHFWWSISLSWVGLCGCLRAFPLCVKSPLVWKVEENQGLVFLWLWRTWPWHFAPCLFSPAWRHQENQGSLALVG